MKPENQIFTIREEKVWELTRERSRFVAMSFRLFHPQENRARLREAIERFPQATHYVYAFRCGSQGKEECASDGGEPRGSAGRPVLGALQHFGMTDTMVVVVRYFGGKKLGIRGLIEAYRDAATGVLEISGRIPYTPKTRLTVTVDPYAFDSFAHCLVGILGTKHGVTFEKDQYRISFSVSKDQEIVIREFLERECSRGRIIKFTEEG